MRAEELFSEATRLLGSQEAAKVWFATPHPELGGLSPNDALDQGCEAVSGLLCDLASGSPG